MWRNLGAFSRVDWAVAEMICLSMEGNWEHEIIAGFNDRLGSWDVKDESLRSHYIRSDEQLGLEVVDNMGLNPHATHSFVTNEVDGDPDILVANMLGSNARNGDGRYGDWLVW